MSYRQRGRVTPHGTGRGGEAVSRPVFAQMIEIVADQQGSAAFAKVGGFAGLVSFAAHTAFETRH